MPELIDAHTHMTASMTLRKFLAADPNYAALRAGRQAGEVLMRGFTAVRDVGGAVLHTVRLGVNYHSEVPTSPDNNRPTRDRRHSTSLWCTAGHGV